MRPARAIPATRRRRALPRSSARCRGAGSGIATSWLIRGFCRTRGCNVFRMQTHVVFWNAIWRKTGGTPRLPTETEKSLFFFSHLVFILFVFSVQPPFFGPADAQLLMSHKQLCLAVPQNSRYSRLLRARDRPSGGRVCMSRRPSLAKSLRCCDLG